MEPDDKSILKALLGLMISIFVLFGTAVVAGSAFDLAWLPWRVKMQTEITRNSNGYVTAQMEMLRQFRLDYDAASPEQRAVIVRQMREIADRIPGNVQPDIASFLKGI